MNNKPDKHLFQRGEWWILAIILLAAILFLLLAGSCDGCSCTSGESAFGGFGNG